MRPPSSEVSLVGVGLQNFVVRYFLVNVDVVFILKSEFSWCKSVRNYKPLCSLMSVENGGTFERYSPKGGGGGYAGARYGFGSQRPLLPLFICPPSSKRSRKVRIVEAWARVYTYSRWRSIDHLLFGREEPEVAGENNTVLCADCTGNNRYAGCLGSIGREEVRFCGIGQIAISPSHLAFLCGEAPFNLTRRVPGYRVS